MIATPREIWVYLAASPLLHLTMTLAAYLAGDYLFRKSGQKAILNPVLIAIVILVSILLLTGTSYESYFEGAQFVHFLLGPATIALAIPLYAQLPRLKRVFGPSLFALAVGSLTAIISAIGIGWALGASRPTLMSLAPKSVTTPIAMGIAEKIGGLPSLTAVLVVTTGIIGAVIAQWLFRLLRVKDEAVQGFAIGVAAHGIGTARAFQISETTGAFSALAMGLNGLATALLLPILIRAWGGQ